MLSKGQSWEDYRRWAQLRVDALNHALRGLPEEQIRYHICFGSWHGPHAYDPPLRNSVDLVLQVRAKYYLMEQANPRHEHEWAIWEDVTLPERTGSSSPAWSRATPMSSSTPSSSRSAWCGSRRRGRQGPGDGGHRLQGTFVHRVSEGMRWAKR